MATVPARYRPVILRAIHRQAEEKPVPVYDHEASPRTARPRPALTSAQRLLALQASIGNAAVVRMLRQADADRGHQRPGQPSVQRSAVLDVLGTRGRPLDTATRTDMERRLGADFSDVRIHDNSAAKSSAAEIGARAYTSGNHVVIGTSGIDKHTLAHELTHVIQQHQGPVAGTDNGAGLKVSDPSDRYELEAEATAARVMAGQAPQMQRAADKGFAEDRLVSATTDRLAPTFVQRDRDYEKTLKDYLDAGGATVLYRAIRISPSIKTNFISKEAQSVPPDGELGATEIYQKLTEWDEGKSISPADIKAEVTVAHHVSGDDYASQYTSFTRDLKSALAYSQNNYKLGPSNNLDFGTTELPISRWAPVIQIDVRHLGDGNRFVDLSNKSIRALTNLSESSAIEDMATEDTEVLITGVIPGSAVTQVHGVEERVKAMSDEEKKSFIENTMRLGPRPDKWDEKNREEWDTLFKRNVPVWFVEYFNSLLKDDDPDVEVDILPPTPAEKKRRAKAAKGSSDSASLGTAGKSNKQQKLMPNLLSFNIDEDS